MKKEKITMRSLIDRYQEITTRIAEIADLCEKEKRSRNEAEDAEYAELTREMQLVEMRMHEVSNVYAQKSDPVKDATQILRDNLSAARQTKIVFTRDLMLVSDATTGGMIPVKIQDLVKPLVEGLILDKVGLPFLTGLSGDYVWPVYEAVEATVLGEGVALTDTKIPVSKLTATPQRIGIAVPVSRQSITQSEGTMEQIVREVLPLAVQKLINKILFSTTKVTNATTLVGPFVGVQTKDQFAFSATPTYAEFCKAKAKVLATGIDGDSLCWVMTKANKAIAESTPKDAGSGIMVCENDKIAGLPVYTTNYIGEGFIGLGDWRYQPMGLFGDLRLTVDPYSKSRNDAVDFVLNADYGTVTLRKEAFLLGKIATA